MNIANLRRLFAAAFPSGAIPRDILLLCLSNIIGAFGEGLYFWVFPLYTQFLNADYVQLGIVLSAMMGFAALVPLPGGFLADRFDRKKILILSWIPWVCAPLLFSFAKDWTQLIPGTLLWGLSMIGVPALNAYIISSIPDKKMLTSALTLVWSSYSFSYIFAPAFGSYLGAIIGMRWVLRLAAVLAAIATGIFFFLHSQHPKKTEEALQTDPLSLTDEKRLWRKIVIWSVFFTITSFFISIGRSYVQTFLSRNLKMTDLEVGVFGSINFAGITFIGIALGRMSDRWRKSGVVGISLMLYVASMIPIMLIREPTFLMPIAFILGGSAVTGSLVSSYVGTIAPKSKRGLWVSIPLTFSLVASFAAPYLGAYLYTFSPYYAFTFSISAVPFLAFYALTKLKD